MYYIVVIAIIYYAIQCKNDITSNHHFFAYAERVTVYYMKAENKPKSGEKKIKKNFLGESASANQDEKAQKKEGRKAPPVKPEFEFGAKMFREFKKNNRLNVGGVEKRITDASLSEWLMKKDIESHTTDAHTPTEEEIKSLPRSKRFFRTKLVINEWANARRGIPKNVQELLIEEFGLPEHYFERELTSAEYAASELNKMMEDVAQSSERWASEFDVPLYHAKQFRSTVFFLAQVIPGFQKRFPMLFEQRSIFHDEHADKFGITQGQAMNAELSAIEYFMNIALQLWHYIECNDLNDYFIRYGALENPEDALDVDTWNSRVEPLNIHSSFSMNVLTNPNGDIKCIDFYKIVPENSDEK